MFDLPVLQKKVKKCLEFINECDIEIVDKYKIDYLRHGML